MQERSCANRLCGQKFTSSTARKYYGRGGTILNSRFCCTECREVARIGRKLFEERVAAGVIRTAPPDREYSDAAVLIYAQQLAQYMAEPSNRGALAWLEERAFGPYDRRAILRAWARIEEECA